MAKLLISDSQFSIAELALLLRTQGYEVVVAPSLDRAVPLAKREKPDLVILNWEQPECVFTGLDVAMMIQALFPQVKVLIYSTYAVGANVQRCHDAGAAALDKATPAKALLFKIEEMLASQTTAA